jgi:hypothetical protein
LCPRFFCFSRPFCLLSLLFEIFSYLVLLSFVSVGLIVFVAVKRSAKLTKPQLLAVKELPVSPFCLCRLFGFQGSVDSVRCAGCFRGFVFQREEAHKALCGRFALHIILQYMSSFQLCCCDLVRCGGRLLLSLLVLLSDLLELSCCGRCHVVLTGTGKGCLHVVLSCFLQNSVHM